VAFGATLDVEVTTRSGKQAVTTSEAAAQVVEIVAGNQP